MRSYKHRLSRKSLENMYKSFILPLFDHADGVWDNCTIKLADESEQLRLDAIRTITGAVRGTSYQSLYRESGFSTLSQRRRRHKIILYHKIVKENPPPYLESLLPSLISAINPYYRRRPLERLIPHHKTELYKFSFFPSTIILWNNLPENIQLNTSISETKKHLQRNDHSVPVHFYIGACHPQIIHTKLHYLLHCPLYTQVCNYTFKHLPRITLPYLCY